MTGMSLRETPRQPFADSAAVEANHRIANNLMALGALFMRQLRDIEKGPETVPKARLVDLVKDMTGRLNALGRLHHLLSANPAGGDSDLGEVLSEVFMGFRSTGMFGDRLNVHLDACGHRVSAAQASMLMLVVAEIATNAAKYAHPTGIPVEFRVSATRTRTGGLMLLIDDDGVGLPEGFDLESATSLGLQIVRTLVVGELGGRLRVIPRPGGGTEAVVDVPVGCDSPPARA